MSVFAAVGLRPSVGRGRAIVTRTPSNYVALACAIARLLPPRGARPAKTRTRPSTSAICSENMVEGYAASRSEGACRQQASLKRIWFPHEFRTAVGLPLTIALFKAHGAEAPGSCGDSNASGCTISTMGWEQRITVNPAVRSGKPCIKGTRIAVYDVLEYLAGGMTEEQILGDFPDLEREDIRASLALAAARERRLSNSVA